MSKHYVTRADLVHGFARIGIAPGDVVIAHTSLSAFGYVIGGAESVVTALQEVLGVSGTLVVPTHTPENSDPTEFCYPALPDRARVLWPEHYPAFDPECSPCPYMGAVPELVRSLPQSLRSAHPWISFAAIGRQAKVITSEHPLTDGMGEHSPLGRIYEQHGKILLLGIEHDSNSSLHLAEVRSGTAQRKTHRAAISVAGHRQWMSYEDVDWDNSLFNDVGEAFEQLFPYQHTRIGAALVRAFDQRSLVDFAAAWFRENRHIREEAYEACMPSKLFEYDGFRLRRPTLADAGSLFERAHQSGWISAIGYEELKSLDDAQDLLCQVLYEWESGSSFSWALETTQGSELLGLVRAIPRDARATLSWSRIETTLGKTVAPLFRQLVQSMFEADSCVRVEYLCLPDDLGGTQLAEAAGFAQEGLLRRYVLGGNGDVGDRLIFAAIREG
jgi:aminoglycoside 3-N-acetyltransferase